MKIFKYYTAVLTIGIGFLLSACSNDDEGVLINDPVTINFESSEIEIEENNVEGMNVIIAFDKQTAFDFDFNVSITTPAGVEYGKDFITIPEAVNNVISLHANVNHRSSFFKVLTLNDNALSNTSATTFEEKLRKELQFTLASTTTNIVVGDVQTLEFSILEDDIPGLVQFELMDGSTTTAPGAYDISLIFSTEVKDAGTLKVFVTSPDGIYGNRSTDEFNTNPLGDGTFVTFDVAAGSSSIPFSLIKTNNLDPSASRTVKFNMVEATGGITIDERMKEFTLTVGDVPGTFSEDFNDCGAGFPSDWTVYSATSNSDFECSDDTRGASGSAGDFGAEMNNFGADVASDDWLITPRLSLSNSPKLQFNSLMRYNGSQVVVLISTDYLGSGDPSLATWTEITTASSAIDTDTDSWDYVASGVIDLSAHSGEVYIGFHHTSSGTGSGEASTFRLDDFELE